MKKFIGIELTVAVAGMGTFKGILLADMRDRILLKGSDGKVTRIPKSQIAMFVPEKEPDGSSSIYVLFCDNREIGCPGVQYIVAGEGFKQSDFHFMKACPCVQDNCRQGSKGELRCVDPALLVRMLDGTLYGDFPEKKEVKE